MSESIVVIPALNSGERLLSIVEELKNAGLDKIILVSQRRPRCPGFIRIATGSSQGNSGFPALLYKLHYSEKVGV